VAGLVAGEQVMLGHFVLLSGPLRLRHQYCAKRNDRQDVLTFHR
jgi:hypothetical protein